MSEMGYFMASDSLENYSSALPLSTSQNVTEGQLMVNVSPSCPNNLVLPVKGMDEEVNNSLKILLMLFVIAACFFQIYFLLRSRFHYIPESSVIVFTGALFGAFFEIFSGHLPGDYNKKEAFEPTTFFLFLLPPIMYESAYNLHKGNFFKNFGSILFFAIFGTTVSAFFIGSSIFLLGQESIVLQLNFPESFAYGAILSSVDPVATLAVFQALDVDPVLNMLVIGESILNDAVSIVLSSTLLEQSQKAGVSEESVSTILLECLTRFVSVFFISAAVGIVSGFVAALLFKHISFRKYPWMEFGMMLIFIYTPYCIAEVLEMSAIITILFNGIVMSHYTHLNLSRIVQSIMQVTLRTMAFIAETSVFAYLGVSLFSYNMVLDLPFVLTSIVLCLLARAFVFPLSIIVNAFRQHQITPRMMFIMWFGAIRGAVSFALALRFEFEEAKRNVVVTSTLMIVLLTTIVFGGGTMPLLKYLQRKDAPPKQAVVSEVCLVKTEKMGETIEPIDVSEAEDEIGFRDPRNFFAYIDAKYLTPFFSISWVTEEANEWESKSSDDFTSRWSLPLN